MKRCSICETSGHRFCNAAETVLLVGQVTVVPALTDTRILCRDPSSLEIFDVPTYTWQHPGKNFFSRPF